MPKTPKRFGLAECNVLKSGIIFLTVNLIKMPFNTFTNRADPDQAAFERAA